MNRNHEKLLVATLCGMIVVGAAAFAVQPSMAAVPATSSALVAEAAPIRFIPDIGAVAPTAPVTIDRCFEIVQRTPACLVDGELPAAPGSTSRSVIAEVRSN